MQNVIDDVAAVGALGTAAGLGLRSLVRSPAVRFARMSGLSIAAPGAAAWVTDFLNAAYYQRPLDERAVDDLRLAYAILATRWQRAGYRRLRAADVVPFHRAFGRDRFVAGADSARGTLNREQLLAGATRLHGAWFPSAYADDARRAWGLAFPSREERDAYDPAARLRAGRSRDRPGTPTTPSPSPGPTPCYGWSRVRRPGRTTPRNWDVSRRYARVVSWVRPSRSTSWRASCRARRCPRAAT